MPSPVSRSSIPMSFLDTDTALTANSDTRVPSQKAIKAYVGLYFLDLATEQTITALKHIANDIALSFDGVGEYSSNAFKTGTDGTFLFDIGSGNNTRFKMGDALGAKYVDFANSSWVSKHKFYSDGKVEHVGTLSASKIINTDLEVTASPSADHTASGTKIALVAGADMNFGDVGYIKSDGKVGLIDADAIATMNGLVMCCDASIATDASGNFLLMGIARDDTWNWTVGGLIYGSTTGTTGNTLTQTAPSGTDDVVQILGVATHADRMYFKPELTYITHT